MILVPEGGARTFSFQLPIALLVAALVVTVILLVATITLFFSQARLLLASRENVQLQRRIDLMETELEKVRALEQHLVHNDRMRAAVLELMGARGQGRDSLAAVAAGTPAGVETDEIRVRQQDFLRSVPSAWPTRGPVTREFANPGDARTPYHPGIDVAAAEGTPVLAAGAGIVTFAGVHTVYGNLLVIDHGLGFETRYAHNSRLNVSQGERVMRGQRIATVGNTGQSSAPHLHFEIHRGGVALDPRQYLD